MVGHITSLVRTNPRHAFFFYNPGQHYNVILEPEVMSDTNIYVSLRLRMQNAVSAQPCVGKLGISLVLLNFLDCNFRLWLETP